jgi:hypothetical protein
MAEPDMTAQVTTVPFALDTLADDPATMYTLSKDTSPDANDAEADDPDVLMNLLTAPLAELMVEAEPTRTPVSPITPFAEEMDGEEPDMILA